MRFVLVACFLFFGCSGDQNYTASTFTPVQDDLNVQCAFTMDVNGTVTVFQRNDDCYFELLKWADRMATLNGFGE